MPGPKTKEQRKKNLQYLNMRIKKKIDIGLNENAYKKRYVPLTDQQIDDFIEGKDSALKSMQEAGKAISDTLLVIDDTTGEKLTYDFDGVFLARIARSTLDYSYLKYEKDSAEYNKIHEKNLKTLEKLKTKEGAQEAFNQMVNNLLSIDFSKVITGNLKSRLEYLKDHTNEMLALFVINDIMTADEMKNVPAELKNALESRRTMLQSLGGIIGLGPVISGDYYPLLAKIPAVDVSTLLMDGWEYPMEDEVSLTDEAKAIETEFSAEVKSSAVGLLSNDEIVQEKDSYNLFIDNVLLGQGDDAVRFEPRDENGKYIDFASAAKKIRNKEKVTFVERTQEEIDHMLRGKPAPEKKYKDDVFEVMGSKCVRKGDNLNPVTPHIKEMTAEEEKQAALKWYDSFKELLDKQEGEYKFDISQKLDTNRFKTFSLGASYTIVKGQDIKTKEHFERKELQRNSLLEIKSVIDSNSKEMDFGQYLNNSVAIKDLTDEQKLTFYRCAKEGKLIFNSSDFDSQKAKAIYINSEGKASVSGLLKSMTTENQGLKTELELDKDYAKKLFPGCEYAEDIAQQYGDYEAAQVATLGMDTHLSDKELAQRMAEGVWEASIQKEYKNHPEFYTNEEDIKERSQIIAKTAKASFKDNNPEWEEYSDILNEHPASYYDDVRNFIEKKAGMTVEQAAAGGYLTTGDAGERNKMFLKGNKILRPNQKCRPWDLVDSISKKILNDENVYLTLPNGEKDPKEYKIINFGEGFKIKEIAPLDKYRQASEAIRNLSQRLNETGVTKDDSSEFKFLKDKLNSLAQNGMPENLDEFANELAQVKKCASDYVFEKLDQKHNTRRANRFDIAADAIVEINKITDFYSSSLKEKEMYIIAAKGAKAMLKALSQKDGKIAEDARRALEQRDIFDSNMENLFEQPFFQNLFKDHSAEEIKKLSSMDANKLGKALIKAKDEYTKQLEKQPLPESKTFRLDAAKHTVVDENQKKAFTNIFRDI